MVALPPAEMLVALSPSVPFVKPTPDPLPSRRTVATLLDDEEPPPPPLDDDDDEPRETGLCPLEQATRVEMNKQQFNFFMNISLVATLLIS